MYKQNHQINGGTKCTSAVGCHSREGRLRCPPGPPVHARRCAQEVGDWGRMHRRRGFHPHGVGRAAIEGRDGMAHGGEEAPLPCAAACREKRGVATGPHVPIRMEVGVACGWSEGARRGDGRGGSRRKEAGRGRGTGSGTPAAAVLRRSETTAKRDGRGRRWGGLLRAGTGAGWARWGRGGGAARITGASEATFCLEGRRA